MIGEPLRTFSIHTTYLLTKVKGRSAVIKNRKVKFPAPSPIVLLFLKKRQVDISPRCLKDFNCEKHATIQCLPAGTPLCPKTSTYFFLEKRKWSGNLSLGRLLHTIRWKDKPLAQL